MAVLASIDKHWARRRIAITADGRQRDEDTLTASNPILGSAIGLAAGSIPRRLTTINA
jgi:hypothetical protein